MSEQKLGVKETIEVLDGVLAVVDLGRAVADDGKLSLSDLAHVVKRAPELAKVIPLAVDGAEKVILEMKDLQPEEAAELVSHVAARLSLPEGKARDVVDAGLKAAASIGLLVKALIK